MMHIAFGTKAQIIKMAPLLWSLKEQGIDYNLIDLGQHSLITRQLREELGLGEPHVSLSHGRNISTVYQAFVWLVQTGVKSVSATWVRRTVFRGLGGICLIHGDTLSTLVGLFLAKRAGIPVAHIEAGLRSFSWREPFPEEIIRILAMRWSDVLYAPSQWAYRNLEAMGFARKAVRLSCNTGYETMVRSLRAPSPKPVPYARYCLCTCHRFENICSVRRLAFMLDAIEEIARHMPVVFVQHQPTLIQLTKKRLLRRLAAMQDLTVFPIVSHAHFMHLMRNAAMVLTDGGSIQEEAYYAGKPCVLLRSHTERQEGLGENAVLSLFNLDTVRDVCRNPGRFTRKPVSCGVRPSLEILEHIAPFAANSGAWYGASPVSPGENPMCRRDYPNK